MITLPPDVDLPSDGEFGVWLSDLLPDDRRTKAVVMLSARVDESGTHANAPVLCVAACLAMPHQWKALRKEWRPHLAGLKHPYHATDHKKNPRKINEALAALIKRHAVVCIAVTISYEDYKAATTPKFRSQMGSEYSVATIQAIFEAERYAVLAKRRWVAYVFEEGHKNSGHLKQLLDKLVALNPRPWRIYSQTWLTKAEPTLHVPDLIAYEVAASHGKAPSDILAGLSSQVLHHHMSREEIDEVVAKAFDRRKR